MNIKHPVIFSVLGVLAATTSFHFHSTGKRFLSSLPQASLADLSLEGFRGEIELLGRKDFGKCQLKKYGELGAFEIILEGNKRKNVIWGFEDASQLTTGSCTPEQIPLSLECVSKDFIKVTSALKAALQKGICGTVDSKWVTALKASLTFEKTPIDWKKKSKEWTAQFKKDKIISFNHCKLQKNNDRLFFEVVNDLSPDKKLVWEQDTPSELLRFNQCHTEYLKMDEDCKTRKLKDAITALRKAAQIGWCGKS